jgi:flagellar motor switch protein FliN
MKTFFETWLNMATAVLERELSRPAKIVPANVPPAQATAVNIAVSVGGTPQGRLTVAADSTLLQVLFAETVLVGSGQSSVPGDERWRKLLKEVTTEAAQAFGDAEIASVEDVQWFLADYSAVYELRVGDIKVALAFNDQVSSALAQWRDRTEGVVESSSKPDRPGIDLLLDVELEASLRFGSCEMSLDEVLELGPGDVVELDRHIADPVDLLVGDKIVARGEVILINGCFGLRVLEVAEPKQCLESIRCLF